MRFLAKVLMGLCSLVSFVGMYELGLASNWLVALLLFVLLQFIAIFVHELGHAVAAKRRGATLEVFSVLWWEYDFTSKRFGGARLLDESDVGGFVSYALGELEPTRQDDAIIVAAGPTANVILALIGLAAAFSLSSIHALPAGPAETVVPYRADTARGLPLANLPSEADAAASMARYDRQRQTEAVTHWLEGVATVLALLSMGMALTNLIPFAGSDGDRLWWALSRKRSRPGRRNS